MRAAAILGLGCSQKNLDPFQTDKSIEWRIGLPAASDEADVVLLFGGDGTVHRHLAQLVKLGLPVLIVPAGSGNDFARALGLSSVHEALTAWKGFCAGTENWRDIDLGVITALDEVDASNSAHTTPAISRYFASVAGVGLDAEVARRAGELPRWLRGHGGYALTLAPTLFRFAPLPMKILARENEGWVLRTDQPTMLAAFANTSTYGGGMKIAPEAKPDDGQLDVCLIGGIDSFRLALMFPTVYFGRHLRIRQVQYFRAERLRVETEIPLDVYADGEFVCRTPVELGVETAALRVIVPSPAS